MGALDIITKDYMKDEHRFADVFNYYLFDGEQIVQADKLREADPVELGIILDGEDSESVQKIRDVLRSALLLTDETCNYLLLGIENQSEVHMAMPVRNLIFFGLRYGEQVSRRAKERRKQKLAQDSAEFLSGFGREDKLKPVITLVLYWQAGEWDGPRSLRDMFDSVDGRLNEFINDYKLHVIVPDEIKDFEKFKTELGLALEFIASSQEDDRIEKIESNPRFSAVMNETVHLLNMCTGSKLELNEKEGEVDMCKGIEDLKKRVREEAFINAIERIAQKVGGIEAACDLYGTTDKEYWDVKNKLALRNG